MPCCGSAESANLYRSRVMCLCVGQHREIERARIPPARREHFRDNWWADKSEADLVRVCVRERGSAPPPSPSFAAVCVLATLYLQQIARLSYESRVEEYSRSVRISLSWLCCKLAPLLLLPPPPLLHCWWWLCDALESGRSVGCLAAAAVVSAACLSGCVVVAKRWRFIWRWPRASNRIASAAAGLAAYSRRGLCCI